MYPFLNFYLSQRKGLTPPPRAGGVGSYDQKNSLKKYTYTCKKYKNVELFLIIGSCFFEKSWAKIHEDKKRELAQDKLGTGKKK